MKETDNINPIVFVEGDEDRVVIETNGYETSLFSSQYVTAFSILKKMLEAPEEDKDENYPGQGNSRIIAFCGDRGAGKTSCMMSVRHAIKHKGDEDVKKYLESNDLKTEDLDFDILNPIDPSFFDESHNILELVLGQLYLHFKSKVNDLKGRDELDLDELEIVKLRFDEVKRSLSLLCDSTKRMFDKLEELENLSVAMSLYEKLQELFRVYLDFIGKKKILITIDDMDFNAEGAYRMCKFLLMYLNQTSCVVLISLKISQLVTILDEDKNFKNAKDQEQRSEMSSKYVQKLIPISNRVQMVDIRSISEREFVIVKRGGEVDADAIKGAERIKDGIVRLIFEKTRYLFYNAKGEVSPIIPHELRSFRQLLGMLYRMDDIVKYAKEPVVISKNENNKLQFRTYFYTEWIRILNKEDRTFAEELATLEDIRSFNKKIVSYLTERGGLDSYTYDDSDYHFNNIYDPQNYTYNISTGDVFSIIRYLDKNTENTGLKDLLFFIKSCYSMRLYESYDEITDHTENMNEEVPDGEVFRSDPWFRRTTKLQSMVNGNYFRYEAGSYIKGRDERTQNVYNYDKVLLNVTFYSFLENLAEKLKTNGGRPSEELKNEYLLAEFFIMCTSYNYYGEEFVLTPDVDRKRSMPYYLEPVSQRSDYVVFDITSIFSNMINIRYSYDRYKSFFDFYDYSDKNDWTLLGRLKKDICDVRDVEVYKTPGHAIASDAIIRNSDVLLSLTEMMESNSPQTLANSIKGAVARYKKFLEGLSDTGMKTYRVGTDGEPYELHYSFIKTVSKMLDEIPEDKMLKLLHSATDIFEEGKVTKQGVGV